MFIILYNPGAGGHMVSSVIDNTDYVMNMSLKNPKLLDIELATGSLRGQFQRITGASGVDNLPKKLELLDRCQTTYKSIALHDISLFFDDYTTDSKMPQFDYIVIDDSEYFELTTKRTLDITVNKFGYLKVHSILLDKDFLKTRKQWLSKEFLSSRGIDKIIPFKEILNGNLLEILKQWTDEPLNEELYHTWLSQVKEYFSA
jgi:hypothetical protein